METLIDRPSRTEWLMRLATIISTRGTCNRAQVGAIIVREGRTISTGYVGAPSGLPHCVAAGDEIGPDGGCTRTVHAEANAIAFAARFGTSTEDAELYCTHSPCVNCAKLIINAGIRRVVYEHEYRDQSGLALLEAAGVGYCQYVVGG
jgi:dCMP deaminase